MNGRKLINSKYAGGKFSLEKLSAELQQKYPDSVRFKENGYSDFSPYAKTSVEVDGLIGDAHYDFLKANEAAGYKETQKIIPGIMRMAKTMQLIPSDIHRAVRHTGGIRNKDYHKE
jgi:filamentous hemagglutinin